MMKNQKPTPEPGLSKSAEKLARIERARVGVAESATRLNEASAEHKDARKEYDEAVAGLLAVIDDEPKPLLELVDDGTT